MRTDERPTGTIYGERVTVQPEKAAAIRTREKAARVLSAPLCRTLVYLRSPSKYAASSTPKRGSPLRFDRKR